MAKAENKIMETKWMVIIIHYKAADMVIEAFTYSDMNEAFAKFRSLGGTEFDKPYCGKTYCASIKSAIGNAYYHTFPSEKTMLL
jgi:hypothetical protein